jgi:hypothetical protein
MCMPHFPTYDVRRAFIEATCIVRRQNAVYVCVLCLRYLLQILDLYLVSGSADVFESRLHDRIGLDGDGVPGCFRADFYRQLR